MTTHREEAWSIVPQDPDFSHLQGLSTDVLDCLQESLCTSMGARDPLRTVILGIIAARDPAAPTELIDMYGNRSRVNRDGTVALENTMQFVEKAAAKKKKKGACWPGYTKVGMKDKDGREVPNCVPNKSRKIAKEHAAATRTASLDPTQLIHDRDTMGNMTADRIPLLDEAIRRFGRRVGVPLFRGLTASEIVDQGDLFQAHGYMLLTEKPACAIGHADASGTGEILIVNGAVALHYPAWLASIRQTLIDAGGDEQDVDARIARAKNEAEWIVGPRTRFSIDETREGSGELAGRRVVVAKPMDESNTLAELLEGVRAEERAGTMTRTNETAAGFEDVNPADHHNDVLLVGGSDVMKRYDSMMIRRRTAALCHQPREAQRLDRKINILRRALGMTDLPPIPVMQSGRAFDQGTALLDTPVQDPWNREWMQQQTAACLARWCETMSERGFRVSRRRVDAGTVAWCATGAERDRGDVRYELHVLGGAWCTAAVRNGETMPLFDAAPGGDEALRAMAGDAWNGAVTGTQAQQYCKSWSTLLRDAAR